MRIGHLVENHHQAFERDLVEPRLAEGESLDEQPLVDSIPAQPVVENAGVDDLRLERESAEAVRKPVVCVPGGPKTLNLPTRISQHGLDRMSAVYNVQPRAVGFGVSLVRMTVTHYLGLRAAKPLICHIIAGFQAKPLGFRADFDSLTIDRADLTHHKASLRARPTRTGHNGVRASVRSVPDHGGVSRAAKGADCKSAGFAFVGSSPTSPTSCGEGR